MQETIQLGEYADGADTVVITNAATRNEVCRITSEYGTEEPELLSYYAQQKILQSLHGMPVMAKALKRLVEKVERIQSIVRSGGTVKREDLIELAMIGVDGRELIDVHEKLDFVTRAGFSVKQSDLNGWFFENEFSADGDASEDFVTRPEAIDAAYQHIMAKNVALQLAA